jgi:hypothetical protein
MYVFITNKGVGAAVVPTVNPTEESSSCCP